MPVLTRKLGPLHVSDLPTLGAVQGRDGTHLFFRAGVTKDQIEGAIGTEDLQIKGTRRSLNAATPSAIQGAMPDETGLLTGKSVLLTFRNGETPAATADWLTYHAREQGADAALIVDRADPAASTFAKDLAALGPAMTVLVVSPIQPLGRDNGPDIRHPDAAPATPKRGTPPVNPWHAPLWEHGVLNLLLHAYFAKASAVVLIDIADLLLPQPGKCTVFDQARAAPGQYVALKGIETYPWRLRKGAPAPHSDHIARRRLERRGLLTWCLAPTSLPDGAALHPGRPFGIGPADAALVPFARCVGVTYPGVDVGRLVKKSDLREEPGLIEVMKRAFNADPIRLPGDTPIPPRPQNPQITIVTAMKNEGPFILDWIAHNRAIGITDHLVYTNDCDDGTDRLLDCLAEAGVTRRDNPFRQSGKVPQYAAFRAAEEESQVRNADWLLTLDVDEYINIHAGRGHIDDLLEAQPDAHLISMPWRIFGSADRETFEDVPVTQAFTQCAPEYAPRPLQAWAFKTLYRNAGLFRRLGVHRPKGLNTGFQSTMSWQDAGGRPLPPAVWQQAWRQSKGQWGYENVTLNHYAARSAESFLIKRERGKVNRTKREQGLAYWFRMNQNADQDLSIQRLAPMTAAEKTALLALPGVAEAHAEAVEWHHARAKYLRSQPDSVGIFEEITSPRMRHLSRIATNFGANVHLVGPQVIPDDIAAIPVGQPFYWTVKLDPA